MIKIKAFLNQLNGWQRIGFVLYVTWVIYWFAIAISYPVKSNYIWDFYYTYTDEFGQGGGKHTRFIWKNFIGLLISPVLIWNSKKIITNLYSWIKEGFNKNKKP